MFANRQGSRLKRRGIVLVLILGMLSLLALIGVTFATFAGQSLINNRNYAAGIARPNAEQLMDYALSQLINDTNNPLSALRGHGILRDMYGNDSVFRGTNPQNSTNSQSKGLLTSVNLGAGNVPLVLTAVRQHTDTLSPLYGRYLQFATNIPAGNASYQYYGLNFTRWTVKIQAGAASVAQSFEVIEDLDGGNDSQWPGVHILTLSNNLTRYNKDQGGNDTISDYDTRAYANANLEDWPARPVAVTAGRPTKQPIPLNNTILNSAFILDGRFMRAFNGPGMSRTLGLTSGYSVPFNVAAYANFRINGSLITRSLPATATPAAMAPTLGDPDIIGMDEDYDACDLENWFLAIQSADGEVMIPSFHRPGILTPEDWGKGTIPAYVGPLYTNTTPQKLMAAAKILRPRQVDNSPLFPSDPIPDPTTGKIKYDVDNDGDGVSDSVWLDLGYPVQRDTGGKIYKPLFAFMVLGQNGRLPLNTVGNLQARDWQTIQDYTAGTVTTPTTPNSYYDAPLWDHASHVGASVNEINPKYALQNAPDSVYGDHVNGIVKYGQLDNTQAVGGTPGTPLYNAQFGVPVDITQLRNLLTGTYPHENATSPDFSKNGEANVVNVNLQSYYLPNNMPDSRDTGYGSGPANANVYRGGVAPVMGRWGEVNGIPTNLTVRLPLQNAFRPLDFGNPVRAGRSVYSGGPIDTLDDDFDSQDPLIYSIGTGDPLGRTARFKSEDSDTFDLAGLPMIPTERIRRFVTPIDPVGVGRVTSWSNRPNDVDDYGTGADGKGRVGFFRFFRPAGIPQSIKYFTAAELTGAPALTVADNYRMPVLNLAAIPDRTSNSYHGYESMRNPIALGTGDNQMANIAVFGAMPYNYNPLQPTETTPKAVTPPLDSPVTTPAAQYNLQSFDNNVNSQSGPSFYVRDASQNPQLTSNGSGIYPPSASTATPIALPNFLNGSTIRTDTNFVVRNSYPFGGLNKDEADEMNLYSPSLADAPFGPSDIEWLYRLQDVDGASLDSRLAKLAPVSFLNPADGLTRRRLFSLESWDLISFAYAHDNPENAFPWNSRFGQYSNASLQAMNQVTPLVGASALDPVNTAFANPYTTEFLPNPTLEVPITGNYVPSPAFNTTPIVLPGKVGNNPVTNWSGNTNPTAYPVQTPAIAHRDRRINLNHPVPISNDPAEPVRQKWVRETYQFLKAVLPPQSVDTPQELAALSQFVVNIVDFRDPDCTTTRFVNTDLEVVPATDKRHADVQFATTVPPKVSTLTYTGEHYPYDPSIYLEQAAAVPNTIAALNPWQAAMNTATADPPVVRRFLVQYGMEYNPVAINEVLAYWTKYKKSNSSSTDLADNKRLYIELVNTLTDPGTNGGSASDMNLAGWDLIIAPDNHAAGRPDPVSGNLNPEVLTLADFRQYQIPATGLSGGGVAPLNATGTPSSKGYYVLAAKDVDATTETFSEVNPVTVDHTIPKTFMPPDPTGGGRYFWLYLRRPANPFDTTAATKEMVVVDSMRFPYADSGASGATGGMPPRDTPTVATRKVYSVQRLQPFRGGHQVPLLDTTLPMSNPYAYGFSEQSDAPNTASNTFSFYGSRDLNPQTTIDDNKNTTTGQPLDPPNTTYRNAEYFQTLGKANSAVDPSWNYFPFHDRDFNSVAELMLVPGCPAGLFTKQFVEHPFPVGSFSTGYLDATYSVNQPASPTRFDETATAPVAVTYPYLPDKFYYTAASVNPFTPPNNTTYDYPVQNGGWTGGGWFKMMEFMEVPSSANGAIGTVDSGTNFDWYREDRKPGLLNLNLIVDEEVFFGVLDDPRLNSMLMSYDYSTTALPRIVSQVDVNGYPYPYWTPTSTNNGGSYPIWSTPSYLPTGTSSLPNLANTPPSGLVDNAAGTPGPRAVYAGRGFTKWDPRQVNMMGTPQTQVGYVHGMKAAFADFLKLRHGGSGFLFANGAGATGSGLAVYGNLRPDPTLTTGGQTEPVAAERPFRSLSFPDINYTVMRPATLPASPLTTPNFGRPAPNHIQSLFQPYTWIGKTEQNAVPVNTTNAVVAPFVAQLSDQTNTGVVSGATTNPFVGDPGVMNPLLAQDTTSPITPVIPPRRLFQIPDYTDSTVLPPAAPKQPSNASLTGQARIMEPTTNDQLTPTDPAGTIYFASLVPSLRNVTNPPPASTTFPNYHVSVKSNFLGSSPTTGGTPTPDRRQHPAFRIEWLQKVMNLTTVRTHQFAVWITVGFFEVLKSGSPTLGIPEVLGQELGAAAGKSIRYRSFFLLDRTRAAGYNPYNPGDFRDVVTYRRRIE